MRRIYEELLREHAAQNRQMAFVVGPRQVGKTTAAKQAFPGADYFLWDRKADREAIIRDGDDLAERLDITSLIRGARHVVFDEIHKYGRWKNFLKGFFDEHAERFRVIVTGSARMDIYRRGSDSLMGRYFLYRVHPLTVGELLRQEPSETKIHSPMEPPGGQIERLISYGGFPEPFLKGNRRFYNRWKRLRMHQLFREDLRDLTRVQELDQMEMMASILSSQSGRLVNYSRLASQVSVSVDTIRRWIGILESFYYCFRIRPWFRNVPKSLRKEPKVYLWDWAAIADTGQKLETLVAGHLFKAVHFWEDMGLGDFALHFLRDKDKREVDFLVVRDGEPWFLVEAKSSGSRSLSRSLVHFQEKTGAPHAFQVGFDRDFVNMDCFAETAPRIVPATTLLSQLV